MIAEIVFSPLLPLPLFFGLAFLAFGLSVLSALQRAPGTLLRTLAMGALVLVLAGPMLSREDRRPLNDVVAIIADQSQSQTLGNRNNATTFAVEHLKTQLDQDGLELRVIDAGGNTNADGTHLFTSLNASLKDVPPERVGAIIFLTDGQVHDVPPLSAAPDIPVQVLLNGDPAEKDRKLTIVEAPPFGIVGSEVSFTVRVDDLGTPEPGPGASAFVRFRVDGGAEGRLPIPVGVNRKIKFNVSHAGMNIVEIEVEPGPNELTLQNNRAVVEVSGVRDRLRVLLVSGEPHAGERTWRNLLKSDPSVDLVHFTILRPPEKQDNTPPQELALISFPVRELFSEKLYDFDLIIFDRYRRRGVIGPQYFNFMTDYVEQGGALLVAAGPDFSSAFSIAGTSLVSILPALPSSRVLENPFKPKISDLGARHPVTRDLADPSVSDPTWGRWFRQIETEETRGHVLMTGLDEKPLLVLNRAGRGRVAALMSDHVWLWARGFEGGGPQAELLRRLSHWLMKEPDLEEEQLRAVIKGNTLEVTRRTMADAAGPVELTSPSGDKHRLEVVSAGPGLFSAKTEIHEMGLYHLTDGTLNALTAAGPINPIETSDVRATDEKLGPLAEKTGGGVYWIGDTPRASDMPSVRSVGVGRTAAGQNWFGVRRSGAYVVDKAQSTTLFPSILAVTIVLAAFLAAWRREGQ